VKMPTTPTPLEIFAEFVADCDHPKLVWVTKGALETARSDFRLLTQAEVIGFIAGGGLEHPVFINSVPWMNNPDLANPILVYAYSFESRIFGYIAIFQSRNGRYKWIVKSFKENIHPDPRCLVAKTPALPAGR